MYRKPYAAAFETTPDKTPATSAGAWLYASRSQPWNGNKGALTAKAATKPRNSQVDVPSVLSCVRSNVPFETPKTMIDASINSEPAIV